MEGRNKPISERQKEGRILRDTPPDVTVLPLEGIDAHILETIESKSSFAAKVTGTPFQARVKPWMDSCFGPVISADKAERNHRFLEEALELVQACGASREDCLQLVDYVYGRPQGDVNQEVGGVMVTFAAHCLAHGVDMHESGEVELTRIWGKIEQIRAKQASKPRGSVLPISPNYSAPVE